MFINKKVEKNETSKAPQKTTQAKNSAKTTPSSDSESSSLLGKSEAVHASQSHTISETLSTGAKKRGPITRIIVKYDVGFNNAIYLRGEGANLNWNHGVILKNIKADEWCWETDLLFNKCEFKVLINDRQYELGENHKLQCGTSYVYTPSFHNI